MKIFIRDAIKRRVFFLVAICLFAFCMDTAIEDLFDGYMQRYERALTNQQSRNALGKVILERLMLIESSIHHIADITTSQAREHFREQLLHAVQDIEKVLDVLKSGGAFDDVLKVNFSNVDQITRTIRFDRHTTDGYVVEAIDLAPKMLDIREHIIALLAAEPYERVDGITTVVRTKEFSRIFKQIEALLLRSREIANKIYYDTHEELKIITAQKEHAGDVFQMVRLSLIIVIFILVCVMLVRTLMKIGDILTERTQADEDTRQAKEYAELLYQVIPSAIFTTDNRKRITSWNDNAARIIGYTADEILGKECSVFSVTPCRQQCGAFSDEIKKPILGKECVIRTKSGAFRTVEKNADVLRDAQGTIIGAIESFRDITAQKQAAEELKKHRMHLEDLVAERTLKLTLINDKLQQEIKERNMIEDALASRLDYEAGLVRCSRALLLGDANVLTDALRHLLEATNASRVYLFQNIEDPADGLCMQLTHEYCEDIVADTTLDKSLFERYPYRNGFLRWQNVLSEGGLINGLVETFPLEERDILEQQHVVALLLLPIIIKESWVGFIGFDDMTRKRLWSDGEVQMLQAAAGMIGNYLERKNANKKLMHAKEIAEQAARKITEAHLDLKIAKIEAEQANITKSQFLANISHEIRTPLNGIIGFAEIIAEAYSLDVVHERAQAILRESETLLSLINALLDHAKIEAGKMELEFLPLHIGRVVKEVKHSFDVRAADKGLALIVAIESNVPMYVIGDILRLRQILMNLVGNAIKFTKEGSITIIVKQVQVCDKQIRLRFSVIDTGLGIAPERQEAIFQSFTQADGTTTREYGGTGLGTTISQELVHLMRGEMGLESELGKGSTFWFEISFDKCADETERKDVEERNEGDVSQVAPDQVYDVLVVEDYVPNQEVVRMHLDNAGYSVTIVDNGLKAVEICQQQHFDLILMDVQMPKLNGYQATERIRTEDSLCRDTYIVAMTANADEASRKQCLQAGMNDVVTKPIRKMTFLTTIHAVLHSHLMPKATENNTASLETGREDPQGKSMPLHYEQAVEEFSGDATLFCTVLKQFITNVTKQMVLLSQAVRNGDAEAIRREAHKIRGGAANLTAMPLADVAAQIEAAAEAGTLEGVAPLLGDLQTLFAHMQAFVADKKIL